MHTNRCFEHRAQLGWPRLHLRLPFAHSAQAFILPWVLAVRVRSGGIFGALCVGWDDNEDVS